MSDDQFTKLFRHMTERFDKIEETLANTATKEELNELRDTVIDFAGRLEDYEVEDAATDHKLLRHERYIEAIADKVGINLDTITV